MVGGGDTLTEKGVLPADLGVGTPGLRATNRGPEWCGPFSAGVPLTGQSRPARERLVVQYRDKAVRIASDPSCCPRSARADVPPWSDVVYDPN
jgi:hypothetical protein